MSLIIKTYYKSYCPYCHNHICKCRKILRPLVVDNKSMEKARYAVKKVKSREKKVIDKRVKSLDNYFETI